MKFTFPPETRVLDGYTIKRAIYRGGFGEVYYALTDAGREVALKLLQNNTEIELRGVQQCLNLSHPNLVTIFDVREDGDGDHWIIMEYVGGETLDAAIRKHPDGMPMEVVRRWLPGIATGVAYLHSRGLVHRDLKPANVFSDEGVVKVGDVGLSKFITPSRRSAQTQSVGTVYYMAPEVAKGRYGKEVDVYAMGVILYEMLTGRVPFDGESTAEILMKHLSEAPDLSKLPPRIQPVIARALKKDPAERFPSMAEFLQAFEAAVLGKSVPVSPGSTPEPVKLTSSDASKSETHPTATGPLWERMKPSAWGWLWIVGVALFFGLKALREMRIAPWEVLSFSMVGLALGYLTYALPRFLAGSTARSKMPSPSLAQSPNTAPQACRLAAAPYSARARTAQWFTAAALAPLFVGGFTTGVAIVAPSLLAIGPNSAFSPDVAALLAAVTTLGSWLLILAVKATEGLRFRHHDRHGVRRTALMLAGLATGAAAWGLAEFLQVDSAALFGRQDSRGLFEWIGERPLLLGKDGAEFPSLPGYMVFFAGLFGLRSWWRQIELRRESRFRAASVLMTILVAWLWSAVFSFPQAWGMLWAALISSTVQLAAPWSPAVRLGHRHGRG